MIFLFQEKMTGNQFQALSWFYQNDNIADLVIFNSWHLPFLIILYSPSEKNGTVESWHNWLLNNWSMLLYWNLVPVLQNVQKIPENYYPRLYLSIDKVWWLNKLWFKKYTQKCTLSHVQYSSWCHRFGKSWDG